MTQLTKRNKKPISQCRGPLCGGGPGLGLGDLARLTSIANVNKSKSKGLAARRIEEEKEKARITNEREAASRAIADANKGCFMTSQGKKVCDAGKGGSIFVSPKQFAKNLDTFISEDLPKATLAIGLLAAAEVEIPFVLVAAAGTRGIGMFNSGFGPGNRARNSRRNV